MALVDLDPVFVRALRLLHSKSKDSASQLRTMLDEAIRHRKGLGPPPSGVSPAAAAAAAASSPQPKRGVPGHLRDDRTRDLNRLKHELSELTNFEHKRARLDSPSGRSTSSAGGFSSKSHTPSPTPPGSRDEKAAGGGGGGGGVGGGGGGGGGHGSTSEPEELDLSAGGGDLADLQLDGLDDCKCCVCKNFNQFKGNTLMECHTCQNLFHQECHSPVVSNEEANDPRLVWNCSECTKKQPSLKLPAKTGSSSSAARASPSKSEFSYKKLDKVLPSGGKPLGMASMASSYKSGSSSSSSSSGKSSSSRSSRSGGTSGSSSSKLSSGGGSGSGGNSSNPLNSSSSSSAPTSSSSSMDKRLQAMRKKAQAGRKIK